MSFDFERMVAAGGGRSRRRNPLGLVRKAIVLGFGVVQLILVARIARDLGYLPEAIPVDLIVAWSDAVAAPVKGIAGSMFGGAEIGAGSGIDPAIIAALAGWSIVEGILWSILGRFM